MRTYVHIYIYIEREISAVGNYIEQHLTKCIDTCIPAYLHTCMPAYLHTCMPAYLHACIPAYLHTCIPACMHRHITHAHALRMYSAILLL